MRCLVLGSSHQKLQHRIELNGIFYPWMRNGRFTKGLKTNTRWALGTLSPVRHISEYSCTSTLYFRISRHGSKKSQRSLTQQQALPRIKIQESTDLSEDGYVSDTSTTNSDDVGDDFLPTAADGSDNKKGTNRN